MPAAIGGRLAGRVVLVTGGGTGIGRAVCLAAAREGADVAIGCHRSAAGARDVQSQVRAMGRRAEVIEADLGDPEAARSLARRAVESMGAVHVLVNNAAVIRRAAFLEFGDAAWEETMAVNLRAVFLCSQEIARDMVRRGIRGRIIAVSSVGGMIAHADLCAYDASKAGVDMLVRSMAVALAVSGITVNSVSPGAIAVERNADEFTGADAGERWKKVIPVGHPGQPEDVAAAVMYLASDDAGFVTGHTLVVDGGQTVALTSPV